MISGKLYKNDIGRWEIVDEGAHREGVLRCQLTSGDVCEVLVGGNWIRTRIECGWDDTKKLSQYYATVPGIKLYEGQPARVD